MSRCICGIVNIESIKVFCSFMVEDFIVTLIPGQDSDSRDKLRNWAEQVDEKGRIEWISGITSDNRHIYIGRKLRGGYSFGTGINIGAINFFSSIIIESNRMLDEMYTGFYGVEFIGGDINLVYPPDKAIEYTREPWGIQYKEPSTYTGVYDIELNKESFRLIKTVDARYVMSQGKISDLPKNIKSKIRIELDEEQSFDELLKFHGYIRNLITFLTRISNNEFEVKLLTKTSYEEKVYYKDFATVKFSGEFFPRSSDLLTAQDVLKLDDIGDGIVPLIKLLNNEDKKPNLLFLPNDIRDRSFISYTQIVDICSAIEVEYNLGCKPEIDMELKEKSRYLAHKINEFIDLVDVEAHLKQKAKSVIGATLKNYRPSLREKIEFLYNSYKDRLRAISTAHHWIPSFSDEIFYEHIKLFTVMRHSTAHQTMNWNGGQIIYTHVMMLIYFSIFERANISEDIAIKCINKGIRNTF